MFFVNRVQERYEVIPRTNTRKEIAVRVTVIIGKLLSAPTRFSTSLLFVGFQNKVHSI